MVQRWSVPQTEQEQVEQWSEATGLPMMAARILVGRGFSREEGQAQYCREIPAADPFALRDMDCAVKRIRQGISAGELMTVYGDYDCDGMMSTVMVGDCLEKLGAHVRRYIPHRAEGYGLNQRAIEKLWKEGVKLIITVDNGITALSEVEIAAELGMDVIITDHHRPREILPRAAAVINPHRLDDESGYEMLCGTGVAFLLCCALTGRDMLKEYSDLLTFATVADVVPLVGQNRRYVQYGLRHMQDTNRAGVKAILEVSGLHGRAITSDQLSFGPVPRINSAGRFDKVADVLEMLVSDENKAKELAERVHELNIYRRQVEDEVAVQVRERLKRSPELQNQPVIVAEGKGWHHGVLGLAASQISKAYGKPCILLGVDGKKAKGSGRSVPGVSLIAGLMACGEHLMQYGGHPQAVGLTMESEGVEGFRQALNCWAETTYEELPDPELLIDCEILPEELTLENIRSVKCLEPFGNGNETPVFLIKNCKLQRIDVLKENRHLRLNFESGGTTFTALRFNMCREAFGFYEGDVLDLAVMLEVNVWREVESVSVKIQDVRLSSACQEELLSQQKCYRKQLCRQEPLEEQENRIRRENMQEIYNYIRCRRAVSALPESMYGRFRSDSDNLCKIQLCMDVLKELNLIVEQPVLGGNVVKALLHPQKKELEDSPTWQRAGIL